MTDPVRKELVEALATMRDSLPVLQAAHNAGVGEALHMHSRVALAIASTNFALSKAEAAEGDGWQPIETAPRDGSWFIIIRQGEPDSYEVGCYDPLIMTVYDPAGDGLYRKIEKTGYEWSGFSNFHRATHWHPLPPAIAAMNSGE